MVDRDHKQEWLEEMRKRMLHTTLSFAGDMPEVQTFLKCCYDGGLGIEETVDLLFKLQQLGRAAPTITRGVSS